MEKSMETKGCIGVILGLYWDYIGMLENEMETTIGGLEPGYLAGSECQFIATWTFWA